MILSGGYNVYPAELAGVIAQHPAVAMVAVASLKDELFPRRSCGFPGRPAQPKTSTGRFCVALCRRDGFECHRCFRTSTFRQPAS